MNKTNYSIRKLHGSEGFTLIELLITIVIAMVILGGLLLSFSSQNSAYKYQNKRIDAVQDLEFSIRFIGDDLRNSLFSGAVQPAENAAFSGTGATTALTFWVWEIDASVAGVDPLTKRAQRKYVWNNVKKSLRYDRIVNTNVAGTIVARADNTATASGEMLPNVTFFKVFKDDVDVASRTSFANIPAPMPVMAILNSSGQPVNVSGYTILIEVEVVAGYKNGVLKDVQGNTTTTKRVWRYVQVYPQAAAN